MPDPIPIRPASSRHASRSLPPRPSRSLPPPPRDTPPESGRARLLCDLVRLAVDGVAEIAGGPAARLIGPTPRGLQHRRQAAMYLAHVAFSVRTVDVARGFGRDTTTVYHAYRQIEDMRDDDGFDAFLDAVETLVSGAAALADGAPG